jgi:hypothetical protein
MDNKFKVEAEGKELVIRNNAGDHAIIPKKYRREVMDMIKEGCNSCIDNLVSSLPRMSSYADNGTIIPGDDKKGIAQGSNPENEKSTTGGEETSSSIIKVYALDDYSDDLKGYKMVITNDKNLKKEGKTIYVNYDDVKDIPKEQVIGDVLITLSLHPNERAKDKARYSYYGKKYIDNAIQNYPDEEFKQTFSQMAKENSIEKRVELSNKYLQTGNDMHIPLNELKGKFNEEEEYRRFMESLTNLSSYYEVDTKGTKEDADAFGVRNASLLYLPTSFEGTIINGAKGLGSKESKAKVKFGYEYIPEVDDIYYNVEFDNYKYSMPKETLEKGMATYSAAKVVRESSYSNRDKAIEEYLKIIGEKK